MKMAYGSFFLGSFSTVLLVLCAILIPFFCARYLAKRTLGNSIGTASISASLCILLTIKFFMGLFPLLLYIPIFAIFFILFVLATTSVIVTLINWTPVNSK